MNSYGHLCKLVFAIETGFVLCEVRSKTTADGFNVLHFTRHIQEIRYMAPYEITEGDTRSRRWRDLGVREINITQTREAEETVDHMNMSVSVRRKTK
jgi:hypothetical protein